MNLNFKAMETTLDEYLSNFTAVKGEKYAEFMNRTFGVLVCGRAIDEALRPEDKDQTTGILCNLMSIACSSLAREAGIPKSDIPIAVQECETMFNSISNASVLPPGVC